MYLLISCVLLTSAQYGLTDNAQKTCPGISTYGNCDGLDWNNPILSRTTLDLEFIELGENPGTCSLVNATVHCNNGEWRKVPPNLPTYIKNLLLAHNKFEAIQNRSFSRFTNLIVLDLSYNFIAQLSPESFFGLSNLKYLNLRFNNLTYEEGMFPQGIFKPLTSLIELLFSKNNENPTKKGLRYPSKELATLTSLQNLYMDGLMNPVFDENFQKLRNLKTLSLSGYLCGSCRILDLREETFIHLSQVKCLYLTNCFIKGQGIGRETFKHLKNLVELDLTHNEGIGIEHLPNLSYSLQHTTTLKQLGLHLIVPRYSFGICLTKESLKFFPPSVEELGAQENSLEAINSEEVVEHLPKGLKSLDLSGNDFKFGPYVSALSKMEQLETLKLNGPSFIYQLPNRFYSYDTLATVSQSNNATCKSNKWGEYNGDHPFILRLPPNLKTLEMNNAGLTYRLSKMRIYPVNSLENLEAKGNKFPSLEGPITGLQHLKKLDLSVSFVEYIQSDFFTSMKSLEKLNLSTNFLGSYFKTNKSKTVFQSLRNLKDLDLAKNAIEFLHKSVFRRLTNLKYLRLSDNLLTRFGCDIGGLHNLLLVNLSRTHIPTLKTEIRQAVDNLTFFGVQLVIDMSTTPISCDCKNLDFLEWMATSPAFDKRFHNYRCDYYDLILQNLTQGYESILINLKRQCISQVYLLLVVSLCVILVLVVVGISLCYRFRWNLRYFYHVAYLAYIKDKKIPSHEFDFDAFVCYAKEDQDFVADVLEPELNGRGLNLYVHGRDFVAGEYISSNIVSAVRRSRKTLVVVTQNMLNSSWCNYEIQMANMEAVHTGRKVLVFLLKEKIPRHCQNINIVYNIQTNTYLDFPPSGDADEETMNAVWEKLARDLKV